MNRTLLKCLLSHINNLKVTKCKLNNQNMQTTCQYFPNHLCPPENPNDLNVDTGMVWIFLREVLCTMSGML